MPSLDRAAALDSRTADWRAMRANDLRARGNERMRVEGARPDWHYQRADALDRGELGRQEQCGEVPLAGAACPCCRRGYKLIRTCGSRWCDGCSERIRFRARKRLVRSVGRAMREAWAKWKRDGAHRYARPQLRLLTLTGPHSGRVDVDRQRLVDAWRRARAWLAKQGTYPYAYVARHEMTAGSDGRGHWHLHVAIIVPWVDWKAFRQEWSRALEYPDAAPPDWGQRAARRHAVGVESAASYISKYIAKPVDADSLDVAATFYTTAYSKRLTHASVGFWDRHVGCCGVDWHRVRCDEWERLDGAVAGAVADVVAWQARPARAPPALRRDIARLAAAL